MSALFPIIVTFCSTRTVPATPRAQMAPPPPGPQLSEGGAAEGLEVRTFCGGGRAGMWGTGEVRDPQGVSDRCVKVWVSMSFCEGWEEWQASGGLGFCWVRAGKGAGTDCAVQCIFGG